MTNLCKLFSYLLLFIFSVELLAQFQPTRNYTGSVQFFDLEGVWINEKPSGKDQRITKLAITNTIVKTYRAVPYFKLGDTEIPTDMVPLVISEEEMAYTADVIQSKCFIMPMRINYKEKLLVYSIIVDPAGRWTGIAKDIFVKQEDFDMSTHKPHRFSPADIEDYWINEWHEGIIIPRFNVFLKNGKWYFRIFKVVNGKHKPIGEYELVKQEADDALVVKWEKRGVEHTLFFRPIRFGSQTIGIDLVIEEVYGDGVPKGIHRQFFVRDPEAERMAAAEKMIEVLKGEWLNVDKHGATSKIIVKNGDAELWVNCNSESGMCALGRKELKGIDGNMVGAYFKTMASIRSLEIDIELEINELAKSDDVIVVNTTIEDLEGMKPPTMRTEVFKRKGAVIPLSALGLESNKP